MLYFNVVSEKNEEYTNNNYDFVKIDDIDAVLSSISVSKTKVQYHTNDKINMDDISVKAEYSDGSSKEVTGYTTNVDSIDMSVSGDKILEIFYEENGITESTTVKIKVEEKQETDTTEETTTKEENITDSSTEEETTSTEETTSEEESTIEPSTEETTKTPGTEETSTEEETTSMEEITSKEDDTTEPSTEETTTKEENTTEPDTDKTTTDTQDTEEPSTEEETTTPVVKKSQKFSVTKSYVKVYGAKKFRVNVKLKKGNGKITYSSSDKKVATVSSTGKVTIKGIGICTIIVKAKETATYKKTVAKITMTVKPKKNQISKLSALNSKSLNVTWKKDTKAKGYELQYSTSKSFKAQDTGLVTIKNNATTTYKIKKLIKGKKYYVRIRAYKDVKVGGKNKRLYGSYSSVKLSGKIK